jgi:hypothetical protein
MIIFCASLHDVYGNSSLRTDPFFTKRLRGCFKEIDELLKQFKLFLNNKKN